jgi:hypothetical protein
MILGHSAASTRLVVEPAGTHGFDFHAIKRKMATLMLKEFACHTHEYSSAAKVAVHGPRRLVTGDRAVDQRRKHYLQTEEHGMPFTVTQ